MEKNTLEERWIEVTQEDIRMGIRNHALLCPVALAAEREFGDNDGQTEAHVFPDRLVLFRTGQREDWTTDGKLEDQIFRFDIHGDFLPGCYRLWRRKLP